MALIKDFRGRADLPVGRGRAGARPYRLGLRLVKLVGAARCAVHVVGFFPKSEN